MIDSIESLEVEYVVSLPPDVWDAMSQMAEKYDHLVWYARHQFRKADPEEWMKTPNDIKQGALRAARNVEERFPAETEELLNLSTCDWAHGFNSGVVAGIRFAMTCAQEVIVPPDPNDENDTTGEEFRAGGLVEALEEFPDLDT